MHRRPKAMEEVDSDENKLFEVRKHIFGIILVYIQTLVGVTVAIALAYFLLPSVIGDTEQALFFGTVFAAIGVLLAIMVTLFASVVYRQNRIIVTDRNISQVLQYGLFSRKVSQLNIVNIEDVTALQNGFLSTIMNYGTLKIETAGEQINFVFTYCPNVNHCAKIILDARERMLGQAAYEDELPLMRKRAAIPVKKRRVQTKVKTKSAVDSEKAQNLGAEIVDQTFTD